MEMVRYGPSPTRLPSNVMTQGNHSNSSPNPTVLVVDDEPDFLALVQSWLEDDGYEVHAAANGWDGLRLFVENRPGLTITDLRMPSMDGFQFISRIREISDAHVLALTGMGDVGNTVRGLELGADEYLVKPVPRRVFLARVRSIFRRATAPLELKTHYRDPVVTLDLLTRTVVIRGEGHHLRPTEYRLLTYLVLNSDRVLPHRELLDNVWGEEGGSLDSLKWHISSLRDKLEDDPQNPRLIATFHRIGYRYMIP